jgi:methionine-gamma-lyase
MASFLDAGSHVVCGESVYGPVTSLLEGPLARLGISATFVDSSDAYAVAAAMEKNTRLVHVETPGNPTMVVSDLDALAAVAHSHGARLCVDNTFLTPILQRPLDLGADIVVHSLTKFINGHADVVGGAMVTRSEDDRRLLRKSLNLLGGVLGPMESFLVLRGLRTLALRMERHCDSALKLAQWLEAREDVEWTRYPGSPSHPQYELSKRQASGGGGVISFGLRGGLEAGRSLMNSVKLAQLAVSLGGVETLIQHPASMTHAGMSPELRLQAGIDDGLVRISVGIEDIDEIIADMEQALDRSEAHTLAEGGSLG